MKKLGSPRLKKKASSKHSRLANYLVSHTPNSKQMITNHSVKKFPITMKPSLTSTPRDSQCEQIVLSLKSVLKNEDTSERDSRQQSKSSREKKHQFRTMTELQQHKVAKSLRHKLPFTSGTIDPQSTSSKRKHTEERPKKKPRRGKKTYSPDKRKTRKLLKEQKSVSAAKKPHKSKKKKKIRLSKRHSDLKSQESAAILDLQIPTKQEKAAIHIQALARGYLIRKKNRPVIDTKSEETDRSIRDLSPIEHSLKLNSVELRRKLSDERKYLLAAREKQRKVERILEEQLVWRRKQQEQLCNLREKDINELQSIPNADLALMSIFQGIIERRYFHLQALFDDNITAIQDALKEQTDANNHESLEKTFQKQSAVATQMIQDQLKGEEMVREVLHNSKEEEFSESFVDQLIALKFEKSVMEDSLCEREDLDFERLFNDIISDCVFECLIDAQLISTAVDKMLSAVLEDEIHCQHYEEASTPSSISPVNTNTDAVVYYLETILLESLHEKYELKHRLNCPILHDPVEVLFQLQEGHKLEEGRALPPLDSKIYLEVQKERNAKVGQEYTEEVAEIVRDADIVHNQMIFDAINESLASFRKYGEKGEPFPWSFNSRQLAHRIDLLQVMSTVRSQIREWNDLKTGQLPGVEMMQSDGEVDEELVYSVREDKLANLLALEVIDFDHHWVDYEFEEDQVKIHVEKLVFDHLVTELIELIG